MGTFKVFGRDVVLLCIIFEECGNCLNIESSWTHWINMALCDAVPPASSILWNIKLMMFTLRVFI